MQEVLTKSFWSSVKKTFYDAMEEPPTAAATSQTPDVDPKEPAASSTPATPEQPTPPAPASE